MVYVHIRKEGMTAKVKTVGAMGLEGKSAIRALDMAFNSFAAL
jgi:hypothetical protein